MKRVREGGLSILRWFFPPVCVACGQILSNSHYICQVCWQKLLPAGHRELDSLWIARTHRTAIYIDELYVCFHYEETIQVIIHHLKYRNFSKIVPELLDKLLQGMAYPFPEKAEEIVPVPLHKRKRRKRGFNQSSLIAKELADRWQLRMQENFLQRVRYTRTQTKLKASDRFQNVAGAFAISSNSSVQNHTVLLVDDLITTGATVNECAKVLKKNGAKRVQVFGLASP